MGEILVYQTLNYVLSTLNCCLHVYIPVGKYSLRAAITTFHFLYIKPW